MARTITAVPSFQPFTNFLKRSAPEQPLVKGVVKAQLNLLPESSTHVVISEAGRRKQAAEALAARIAYDIDI